MAADERKNKTMKEKKKEEQVKESHPLRDMRKVGVPLVAWESFDPAATIESCKRALNGKVGDGPEAVPVLSWDMVRGLIGLNKLGSASVTSVGYELGEPLPSTLFKLRTLEKFSLVFIHQSHKALEWDGVTQAVWLLRDEFKEKGSTLVLLWSGGKLPPELGHDVIEIKESAPTPAQIKAMAESLLKPLEKPEFAWEKEKTVEGLKGLLSMFDAEQTLALSVSLKGVNVPSIWERKIQRLKGSTGADITINNPNFSELSGCENIKNELRGFINGRQRPGVVLFMDEIEKMFGGAGTDLSGTTTNMLGQWLTWTQEKRVRGFLLAGIPGGGKSWTGACAAGEAGVPFFKLNISETKGSLVGQSEQQMKQALAAVDAISGGNVLLIASCNWVDQLTPDVMGRFTMGTYFYDFPSDEEREALIRQYFDKYGLPSDEERAAVTCSGGWVGREIENACFKAWQFNRSFVDVAANVAPSCISQKEKLDKLRQSCSLRFLSASLPGLYQYQPVNVSGPAPAVKSGRRALNFD
jgi:hypothetical protein